MTRHPDRAAAARDHQVNEPLRVGGTKVFLIGHGYAPHVTVRDGQGRVVLSAAGAVPAARRQVPVARASSRRRTRGPTQLGFRGLFLPTAAIDPVRGGISTFPAADNPQLLLTLFKGDLGLDNGAASRSTSSTPPR